MTDRLKIALAQMNQRVGDLEANAAAMLEMRRRAGDADLLVCPELQLTGYPPEDLVLKPEFVRRAMECAERLVDAIAGEDLPYEGTTMPLSVAIGVSMLEDGDTPSSVLSRADREMYRVKSAA